VPHPRAGLNNLAVLRLEHDGQPAEALRILAPNLDGTLPQPYARALAARCHVKLGAPEQAERHLNIAIRDFELTLARRDVSAGENLTTLREYTAIILWAAGDLGDDLRISLIVNAAFAPS